MRVTIEMSGDKKLPYLTLIIDELADLMATALMESSISYDD